MSFTMGNGEKPFVCTKKGCNMSFSNEDHLSVHSKTHMTLNLGLSKTPTIADQTPTPTRFIRNCEEVGLFQDLQNVNPFDETFRKAIENSKNGMTHVIEHTSEDSLHTPQIFETSTKPIAQKYEQPDMPEDFSLHTVITIDDVTKTDNDLDNDIYENGEIETRNFHQVTFENESEIDLCSSNSSGAILPDGKGETSESTVVNVDYKAELREKLKEALHKRKAGEDPLEIDDTDKTYFNIRRPRLELKNEVPNKRFNVKSIDIYGKNVNEVDRRRLMNRLAQMRSRERKKIWLDQMKDEMTKLKGENKYLVNENQKLKEENAYLKSVLLAHNQCSLDMDVKQQKEKLPQPVTNSIKKLKPIKPKPVILTPLKLNTSQAVVTTIHLPSSQRKNKDLPLLLPKPVEITPNLAVGKTPVIKHTSILPQPSVLANTTSQSPKLAKTLSAISLNGDTSVILQIKPET